MFFFFHPISDPDVSQPFRDFLYDEFLMRVSEETAATSQKNNTLKFIAFITGPENYSLPKKNNKIRILHQHQLWHGNATTATLSEKQQS